MNSNGSLNGAATTTLGSPFSVSVIVTDTATLIASPAQSVSVHHLRQG
jgi:hypothetical protein